jgi:ABC-type transport system involved in multi-copper enzyme maturation permease subunit
MKWLLWKEYRQNRVVVVATLLFLIVPHLIAIYPTWKGESDYGSRGVRPWQSNFAASSFFGLMLAQLTIGVIGGNVIAGERADRSAEFQACLPIPRSKLLAAKILLSLAIVALAWLPNGCLLCFLTGARALGNGSVSEMLDMMGGMAATALTFFCVAWFFSSFLSSVTYAAAQD